VDSAGIVARGQSARGAAMNVSEIPNAVMEIIRVPMFTDNYGWILRDRETGTVAAVDPADSAAIQSALEERCLSVLTVVSVRSEAVTVRLLGSSR
jgi:selenophosphate synthetase-related protein